MIRPLRVAALLLLVALSSLAACAAAPPPTAAPETAPSGLLTAGQPRGPSPLDTEMVAIGRAEEEIDRLFPESGALAGPRKGGGIARPTTDDAAKPDAPASKDEASAAHRASAGDACATACRALTSMASSADRLCKLSGEDDGRCDDARSRVRGAAARVKSACPGCSVSTQAPATAPGPAKAPPPPGPAPGMPGSSAVPIP
jgi:hypothetical protein